MRKKKELLTDIQKAASAMGRLGTGASKRRAVDYSALARKAHEKRATNKEKKET